MRPFQFLLGSRPAQKARGVVAIRNGLLESLLLSALELRRVIETAFLPAQCECEVSPDGTVSITLINSEDKRYDYSVSGIHIADLASSRSIASLVLALKEEAKLSALLKDYHQRQG